MDEKIRFIAAVQEDPRGNFTQQCARFGISRAKGYKWLQRYREHGPEGLRDRKPVPGSCPHKTPDAVEDRILLLRKKYPHYGPKKLRPMLMEMAPELPIPAASTIGDILDRYGLIRPRRVRLRVPPNSSPLAHAQQANDVWCVDFKGDFALDDGTRCYPLTITDAASRYLIKCESVLRPDETHCRPHFERAFQEFGLPNRIRSDNGPPFASKALGGLSRLSVWWLQLGIEPERIEPGKPQQNGRHERFHLTLKQHTASPPRSNATDQQRAFDRFRHEYNDVRPHEALSQTPPARHYEPSLRPMPDQPQAPHYDPDVTVRWVTAKGMMSFKGTLLYVGEVLGRQPVGLRQIDTDEWELLYGPVLLGHLLVRKGVSRLEPFR